MLVEHPGGVTFLAPEGWAGAELDPALGQAALAVLEPDDGAFRANLVLTVVDNGGLSFRDWQARTDEVLPGELADYLLLDLEKMTVLGRPGGRRLACHRGPDGDALVMEQWFADVDGVGVTLTATTPSLRYADLAPELAASAASLSLVDRRPADGADR